MSPIRQWIASGALAAFLLGPTFSHAQAAPNFEVATIKHSDPARRNGGFHVNANRVEVLNQTIETMLVVAYSIHPKQIVNAPQWFSTERFDLNGVANTDKDLSVPEVQAMLRTILAERVNLKLKHERREMPAYALTVSKGGPKLTISKADPNTLPFQNQNGKGNLECTNTSMTMFLLGMQTEMDRPLVDQTGLTGKYDFTLHWTPDTTNAVAGNGDAPPGIFTAIQEQMGLKLVPVMTAVDVLVVEGATQPSEK